MPPFIAPDEQDEPSVLFSSHSLADDFRTGSATRVVPRDQNPRHRNATFCTVLDFPDLAKHLSGDKVQTLVTAFSNRLCHSYQMSTAKGISTLTDALVALHVYLGYIRRDYPEVPLTGSVSVAEVQGNNIQVAWTDGTCHVVTGQATADIFPTESQRACGLAGGSSRLVPGTYKGQIAPGQGFFLATLGWVNAKDRALAPEAAKRVLAAAVTEIANQTRPERLAWFKSHSRQHQAPGLVVAIPLAATEYKTDRTRFVAAIKPASVPDETTAEIPETPSSDPEALREPDLEPEFDFTMSEPEVILAPSELEERSDRPRSSRPVEPNPANNDIKEPETVPTTRVQSALDTRSQRVTPGHATLKATNRLLHGLGQSMRVWFAEAFPDPNAQHQSLSRPEQSKATPDTPVPSVQADPPIEASAQTLAGLPNLQEIHGSLQTRQSSRQIPKSWSAILLLCLLITIPLATFVAYRINQPVVNQEDPVALSLIQQHVESADSLLGREQFQAAQKELQEARQQAQTLQASYGQSPGLLVLQQRILELWDEAFQRISLVGLTEPVLTFDRNQPPAVMAVNFQDLYVLDGDRRAITKFRLDSLRQGDDGAPQVVLSSDSLVDGVTVGRIVDMAFQPTKTAHSDKPSLYVIDDNRHLFQYNDSDLVSLVNLGDNDEWDNPIQIDFYANRLYVADSGNGQIWRYNLNQSVVTEEAWLPEPIDLSGTIGMHVGDFIWLLFDNDSVVLLGKPEKGNQSNIQLPFAVHGAVGYNSRFVDLEVDTETNDYMMLVDAGRASILVIDPSTGQFRHQLVPPGGMEPVFEDLKDVFVHRDTMYILTEHALYEHSYTP